METFELLKKYFRFLGSTHQDANLYEKLSGVAVICSLLGIYLVYILTTLWFFAFEAKTFMERAESLYYLLSSLSMFVWYVNIVWQKSEHKSLFDELDKIIAKSECKIIGPIKLCQLKRLKRTAIKEQNHKHK